MLSSVAAFILHKKSVKKGHTAPDQMPHNGGKMFISMFIDMAMYMSINPSNLSGNTTSPRQYIQNLLLVFVQTVQ